MKCICSTLTYALDSDLATIEHGRHHHCCPLYKTEMHPRLFYYEEACESWIPVPEKVEGELICTGDQLDDGEVMELRFKRIDMTDEQFYNLPEA